jgi:hypothetical protein
MRCAGALVTFVIVWLSEPMLVLIAVPEQGPQNVALPVNYRTSQAIYLRNRRGRNGVRNDTAQLGIT